MATSKRRPAKQFVKAQDTDVPVEKSREDIRALLRRYGAVGFGVQEDYRTGRVAISFVLQSDHGTTPIQIPVDVGRVYAALYERPRKMGGDPFKDDAAMGARRREQAERTAWRQLHLLVDAALTAASLGIMPLRDIFMAHTLVVADDGRTERMADYLDRVQGALAPGVRALLPAQTEG